MNAASGKKLGRIVHGFANTANVAFGGDDWKTVYFCTRTSLRMFKVKIAGVPVPVTKKSQPQFVNLNTPRALVSSGTGLRRAHWQAR